MGIIFLFIGDPISVSQCSYGNLTTRYYGTFQVKKIYRYHDNFQFLWSKKDLFNFAQKSLLKMILF